jgi:hypothetical protein
MTTKKTCVYVVAAGAFLGGLWFFFKLGLDRTLGNSNDGLGSGTTARTGLDQDHQLNDHSSVRTDKSKLLATNESAAVESEWQHIEGLLAQPHHRPLMREVPRLSPAAEARLVSLYQRIPEITNKYHIVRILAFGGGSLGARTLMNAVTNEYSDRTLGVQEHAVLTYIPQLLGVLARHSQEAFEFLKAASCPKFWLERRLWDAGLQGGVDHLACIMAGACIKGLAVSGRPEASELNNWYRTHPDEVTLFSTSGSVICRCDGALAEAAFKNYVVRERGITTAFDVVFYDSGVYMREFGRWLQTDEGQRWYEWHGSIQSVVTHSQQSLPGSTD